MIDGSADGQPHEFSLASLYKYLPVSSKQLVARIMGFKCFLVKHRACTHRWGCLLNILEVSIGVIFSIYYRLLLELSAQYTEGYY